MSGKQSQAKGAEGEKELKAIMGKAGFPLIWGGNRSYGKKPDLRGLPGIHIECKRVEHLSIYRAMEQAEGDSRRFEDGLPTVYHRRNNEDWLVTMRLEDWLKVYKGWRKSKQKPPIEQDHNTRAPFLVQRQFDLLRKSAMESLTEPLQQRQEMKHMKPKFWETEHPYEADTGKNTIAYYPEGEALMICKPNWEKDGVVRRGKSVTLDIAALKSCPRAVQILQSVVNQAKTEPPKT